ncbi:MULTISPECIES: hypothetical protein [Aphanothece]|uniref:hypothetical protein n=1 Tax=Aphanothece TaxID=1121 RepID=UPI00398E9BEE
MPDLPFSSTQLLAGVASVLLLFVSAGVVYLSVVDWRDRRRRRAAEAPGGGSGKPAARKRSARQAGAPSPPGIGAGLSPSRRRSPRP